MFHTSAEGALFLGRTTSAIAHANHRFDLRVRRHPHRTEEVIGVLLKGL
jgi:hypothetical protein